jgi:hypothetical protein
MPELGGGGAPTLFHPLETANHNHWFQVSATIFVARFHVISLRNSLVSAAVILTRHEISVWRRVKILPP